MRRFTSKAMIVIDIIPVKIQTDSNKTSFGDFPEFSRSVREKYDQMRKQKLTGETLVC